MALAIVLQLPCLLDLPPGRSQHMRIHITGMLMVYGPADEKLAFAGTSLPLRLQQHGGRDPRPCLKPSAAEAKPWHAAVSPPCLRCDVCHEAENPLDLCSVLSLSYFNLVCS